MQFNSYRTISDRKQYQSKSLTRIVNFRISSIFNFETHVLHTIYLERGNWGYGQLHLSRYQFKSDNLSSKQNSKVPDFLRFVARE
jgi:hypothetical protein